MQKFTVTNRQEQKGLSRRRNVLSTELLGTAITGLALKVSCMGTTPESVVSGLKSVAVAHGLTLRSRIQPTRNHVIVWCEDLQRVDSERREGV